MPTSDMKTVKGLNIAIIALSSLSAIVFLAFTALMAIGIEAMDEADLHSLFSYGLGTELYDYSYAYVPYGSEIALATTSIVLGIVIIAFLWCFLCAIVSLVAGILALRNAQNPQKLGAAFVWTIIAAVAAFLSGRMIVMALLIVSALFIHRVRKSAAEPAYVPYTSYQSAYAYAPQPEQPAYTYTPQSQPEQPAYAYTQQPQPATESDPQSDERN